MLRHIERERDAVVGLHRSQTHGPDRTIGGRRVGGSEYGRVQPPVRHIVFCQQNISIKPVLAYSICVIVTTAYEI
ncbi:hypothetical protein ACN38_g2768 [Penicillium nordicum]|uniref:Uncharacterized protein n=1 Tax=Penicillium nordicum TaxID=229535 RepID=A0A0M9WIM3_9EURO|nr:hypothetical protein ACN38_g2768 [Penicillium nordicum]